MTITWHTKNINIQNYYKIIKRVYMLNAHNDTYNTKNSSSYTAWQKFKNEWDVHVFPADRLDEFKHFFAHIPNIKVSQNIAWGVTGQKEMFLFVVDSRNPFIIRSNAMPISHEILHAIYQDAVGTFHITRKYDSPEGRKGTMGAAATVIVHDNWYGRKMNERFWISWGLGWLPITFSYIPIWIAKQWYAI